MRLLFPFCLIILTCGAFGQCLHDSVTVNWSEAGLQGSVPEYSNIQDVTSFGAIANDTINDHAAVLSAISALNGNPGVVFFPPGEYRLNDMISLPDSTVLRGAGADSTLLLFNMNGATTNAINISHGQSHSFIPVLSGYQKGSVQLLVAGADTLFSPGEEIEMQEANGAWDTNPVAWADFSVGHLSRIDAVSGDTIWLHESLRMNFEQALAPEIRKIETRKGCGIECIKITRVDGSAPGVNYGVNFNYASSCWMGGVESEKSIGAHVCIQFSSQIEITGCYFHEAYLYDGASTHGYGVMMISHSCNNKVENNIFRFLRHAMIVKQGANGNVFAYNYSREPNRSEAIADYAADICLHGHYAFANLFEGNISQNLQIDQAWGPSGPFNTFFRNKVELYGIIMSSGTVQSDRQNFVGNDVSNMSLFHGLYSLAGTGHIEFGNNVRGNITPNGTTNLPDTSYFLRTFPPSYWDIPASLPSIGIPNTYAMDINPALQRYNNGGLLTVCNDHQDSSITTGSQQDSRKNYNITSYQLTKQSLMLGIYCDQEMDVRIELLSLSGQRITWRNCDLQSGTNIVVMDLNALISYGMYFVHLYNSEKSITKKVVSEINSQ